MRSGCPPGPQCYNREKRLAEGATPIRLVQQKGEMMRPRTSMWALFAIAAIVAAGCMSPGYSLPPGPRLAEPGPGVTGPGPGVFAPIDVPCQDGAGLPAQLVQVLFARPDGMQVQWDIGGAGQFDSVPLVVPGADNFQQSAIYRLKLTNIPQQEGVELYPTLEIGPPTPRTQAFLAHNAIPVQLTVEDFNQVVSGNYVTKVIYLPDSEFQQPAVAGVDTLVSTRLDPGVDPIVEADRRGAILGVLRIGNKDMEMPGVNIEESFTVPGQPMGDGMATAAYAGSLGPATRVRGGCERSSVRNDDERHADWAARTTPHSAGHPGRPEEARNQEPHAYLHPGAHRAGENPRQAASGGDLSHAAQQSVDSPVQSSDLRHCVPGQPCGYCSSTP